MQRQFFEKQSLKAWSDGTLPHYITTNPFIAKAYARMVMGFLRDCQLTALRSPRDFSRSLDYSQPIYIVELGSGNGRFGYLFLKQFCDLYDHSTLKDIPFKYIMTDLSEPNVVYWQGHQWLRPFVERGVLDFARFDAEHDRELMLKHSGEVLSPGTARNPIVVLANYVFDCIPQDVFHVKNGEIYESLVTVSTSQTDSDPSDPESLSHIEIQYNDRPIAPDYYEDAGMNRVLQTYQQRLADTTFLFPYTALRCIQVLSELGDGRLFLVSADKGTTQERSLLGSQIPDLVLHGNCFSMMVNYHALGQYVLERGGTVLTMPDSQTSLAVAAFLLNYAPSEVTETTQAYQAAIKDFSPDDFFVLKEQIEQHFEDSSLYQILAHLRLSGWDPYTFLSAFETLMQYVDSAVGDLRQELYSVVQSVWAQYYPIGERYDIAFHLGLLLYGLQYYREAMQYFQDSIELHGPESGTLYNLGLCYVHLRQIDAALECVNRSLELSPDYDSARALRVTLEDELGRQQAMRSNTAYAAADTDFFCDTKPISLVRVHAIG